MKIGKYCKFFEKSEVALGEGSVTQYIVFEHKKLLSLIFYRWNTIDQVRFHSHCFPALAFLIKGWYWEKVRFGKHIMTNFVNVPLIPRFLPRNYVHNIQNSKPGTVTMVLAGPWQENWFEYFEESKTWVKYGWGRKKIAKIHENEAHLDDKLSSILGISVKNGK